MKQRGFSAILILVGVLIMAAVAGGAYYFGRQTVSNPQPQNPVVVSQTPQPTSVSQATPIPSPDQTTNWKTYTNTKYGYSFKYPPERVIKGGGRTTSPTDTPESILLDWPPGTQGDNYPDFYVDVITGNNSLSSTYNYDGFMENLNQYKTTSIGETVSPPNQPFNGKFTRKNDTEVVGLKAKVFIEPNFHDTRIVLYKNNYYYIIGGYNTNFTDTQGTHFNQILSTFKFTQ